MINIDIKNKDVFYRYKMPRPELIHTAKTTQITNIIQISKALNRPPKFIKQFFSFNLNTNTKLIKNDEFLEINGIINEKSFLDSLSKYISHYVLCNKCKNPETIYKVKNNINRKENIIISECLACGENTVLVSDRMTKFISKNFSEQINIYEKNTGDEDEKSISQEKYENKPIKKEPLSPEKFVENFAEKLKSSKCDSKDKKIFKLLELMLLNNNTDVGEALKIIFKEKVLKKSFVLKHYLKTKDSIDVLENNYGDFTFNSQEMNAENLSDNLLKGGVIAIRSKIIEFLGL